MKNKYLLLLVFLFTSISSFAQNRNIKYCEVVTYERGFSANHLVIEISLGQVDSLFSLKDDKLKAQLLKVNNLKTASDVLNYMSSLGWSFIAVTSISTGGTNRYYFKKEFDPSELATK